MCYSNEGTCFERLKLKYDKLLSNFTFKFNLRCYTKEIGGEAIGKVMGFSGSNIKRIQAGGGYCDQALDRR